MYDSHLTRRDQQVPTYPQYQQQQVAIGKVDPRVPLLEEILTHEQNTCIEVMTSLQCVLCGVVCAVRQPTQCLTVTMQIRDTCTIMAQSVRDVLGSACPKGGYVQSMKDRLGQLEKAVTTLETTIKRKAAFSADFLDAESQRWFEKR